MTKPRLTLVLVSLAIFVAWAGYRLGLRSDEAEEPWKIDTPALGAVRDEGGGPEEGGLDPIVPNHRPVALQADRVIAQIEGRSEAPRVVGTVVDSEGNAIAEAHLDLMASASVFLTRPRAGRPLDGAVSSELGRFEFRRSVVPGARYLLRVRHADFAWQWVQPIDSLLPSSLSPRVVLSRGYALAGTVLRQGGGSVSSARVRVFDQEVPVGSSAERLEAEVLSDGGGHYRFDHLRAGRKLVQAEAAGLGTRVRTGVLVGPQSTQVAVDVTLGAGRVIRGRVVEVGTHRPIADAKIRARPLRATGIQEAPVSARSLSNGFFVLEGAYAGSVVLEASAKGYLGGSPVAAREGVEALIELPRAATLSGRVTSSAGVVRSFVLSLSPSPRQVGSFGRRWTFDGTDGSFELTDCPPGTHYIGVTAPGYPAARVGPIRVGAGERRRGIQIDLVPGGMISGRVVSSGGDGVSGARVVLIQRPTARAQALPGRARLPEGGGVSLRIRTARAEVRTLPDGSFVIPGVAVGEFRLRVEAESYAPAESEVITISGVERKTLPDLRLWRASALQGVVMTQAGRALPLARVLLVPVDVVARGQVNRQVVSDVEGRFKISGLLPGVYRVRATRRRSPAPDGGRGDKTTLVEGETKSIQLLER